MKRYLCILMSVLMLTVVSLTVYADSSRAVSAWLSISFENSVAYYSTTVTSDYTDDEVEAKVLFWHDGVVLARHTISGLGYATCEFPYPAEVGETYTLTVDYSINGVKRPTISSSRTYYAE